MKVKAKVDFLHDQLGHVESGAAIDVNEAQARSLAVLGYIEPIEQKTDAKPKK